jgi:methylmalonyl-CoA mutase cobalamin-binding subunit
MSKDDIDALAKLGIGRLFGPGASTQDAIAYIRETVGARRTRKN